MPRLLLVHHSPTPTSRALLDAAIAGAHDDAIEDVEVLVRAALEATADDVLAADGLLLATPANFGYVSGALKDFFDRTFLDVGGALAEDGAAGGRGATTRTPYGLMVHGRYDATGAVRSVEGIVGALPWRRAVEPLVVLGDLEEEHRSAAYDLGATLAALVMS